MTTRERLTLLQLVFNGTPPVNYRSNVRLINQIAEQSDSEELSGTLPPALASDCTSLAPGPTGRWPRLPISVNSTH
ncbi:hypothetical protein [Mycobacterium lepromatosis]|uniref:hypothetical protein n=1 Tax=Mycobacterium lepromatosis TaxID=480418 RepID=UPI001EDA59A1|nr:hypothetical protein [Mycobacterium lepromatosis]